MSVNVRCAGKPIEGFLRIDDTTTDTRIQFQRLPCGWEGERPGRPTKVNGEVHWNILTIPDDPCPNCGCRVELIPQDAETTPADQIAAVVRKGVKLLKGNVTRYSERMMVDGLWVVLRVMEADSQRDESSEQAAFDEQLAGDDTGRFAR